MISLDLQHGIERQNEGEQGKRKTKCHNLSLPFLSQTMDDHGPSQYLRWLPRNPSYQYFHRNKEQNHSRPVRYHESRPTIRPLAKVGRPVLAEQPVGSPSRQLLLVRSGRELPQLGDLDRGDDVIVWMMERIQNKIQQIFKVSCLHRSSISYLLTLIHLDSFYFSLLTENNNDLGILDKLRNQ